MFGLLSADCLETNKALKAASLSLPRRVAGHGVRCFDWSRASSPHRAGGGSKEANFQCHHHFARPPSTSTDASSPQGSQQAAVNCRMSVA